MFYNRYPFNIVNENPSEVIRDAVFLRKERAAEFSGTVMECSEEMQLVVDELARWIMGLEEEHEQLKLVDVQLVMRPPYMTKKAIVGVKVMMRPVNIEEIVIDECEIEELNHHPQKKALLLE